MNINGIKGPNKRHGLKISSIYMLPRRLKIRPTSKLHSLHTQIESEWWNKIFHSNRNKKVGVAILMSDKIGLLKKSNKR